MENLSLFYIGLILVVFAGFFHVYRYSLNEAQKVPTPPKPLSKERPKMLAKEPSTSEPGQLPEGGPGGDDKSEKPKELPQEAPTAQVKADTVNLNKDTNIGSSDIPKP